MDKKRNDYLTVNTLMLGMLMIEHMDELEPLPIFAKRLKHTGRQFIKELENVVAPEITNMCNSNPEHYLDYQKGLHCLIETIATFDGAMLQDFVDLAKALKNDHEGFMFHFKKI